MTGSESTVNIGLRERKLRRVLGFVFLIGSIAVAVIFIMSGTQPLWGLVLLPFYYQGVRFILDHRTGTCPLKAELGQYKLEGLLTIYGDKLDDENLAMQIRTKSRKALGQALGAAVLLSLLTILVMAGF